MKDVMFSTGNIEWETPADFFDKLNKEFNFTLDPCASQTNYKCEKYYTKKDDGLTKNWSGERVFCNPPYGRKDTGTWVQKCYEESQHCGVVVMLIPARTDTAWFHKYIYNKAEVRFVKGRLKFGGSKYAAPFPSMIVIFQQQR